jgi:hypothetical protein
MQELKLKMEKNCNIDREQTKEERKHNHPFAFQRT